MNLHDFMARMVRNADGGGGGVGGDAAPVTPAPAPEPENVLFPADNQGQGDSVAGGEQKPADAWKEYEPDPAKSDEENAAAKAEHDKAKPDATADKVPEDGKYDLKMPDGVELDSELAEALGPDFKELGLTNAQAQKLVDRYVAIQQARAGKQSEAFAATVTGWAEQARKDPEIGGDKWDTSVQAAQRAVKALGTPALREYLNASGGGNHPELIRFMAKAGAMISEDVPASGGAAGNGKPADPAYTLFPSDAPKG